MEGKGRLGGGGGGGGGERERERERERGKDCGINISNSETVHKLYCHIYVLMDNSIFL